MSIVNDLRELADFLETRPALAEKLEKEEPSLAAWLFSGTDDAVRAACIRELGACTKDADGGQMSLIRRFGCLGLKLNLYGVCRKVKKLVETEVWECPSVLELANEDKVTA